MRTWKTPLGSNSSAARPTSDIVRTTPQVANPVHGSYRLTGFFDASERALSKAIF